MQMFITVNDAAAILKTTPERVMEMAGLGKLQPYRDRDKIMFKREQVESMAADCPGCQPGTVHGGGERMQPPPITHGYESIVGSGFRTRGTPSNNPHHIPNAQTERRLQEFISLEPLRRLAMNPDRFPEKAAPFVMLMNSITKIELQVAAIERALMARGLLTQPELFRALAEVNAEYDAQIKEMGSQAFSVPPTPPPVPPATPEDPRRSP